MWGALLIACVCVAGETYEFPDDTLTFDLRKLKSIEWVEEALDPGKFDTSARCRGRFGALKLELTLRRDYTTNTDWRPHHVLSLVEDEERAADPGFFFQRRMGVPGKAGKVAYLLAGIDNPPRGDDGGRALLALCGVTATAKYAIEIRTAGALSDRDIDSLTQWVGGALAYDGDVQDPDWTDDELDGLWRSVAPDALGDDLKVLRTKHYVILTNADVGKEFGKVMEECYELVQDVFPAPELKGYRLLPVVLFRTRSDYIDAYLKINEDSTREQAQRSLGTCPGEHYITFHDSTDARTHVYLAAQQIVRNRHWLTAGNTWFRAGFGEYLETAEDVRKEYALEVKAWRFVPLNDFMLMKSFGETSGAKDQYGFSSAANLYDQAAALVEFFVESRFAKKRYVEFFLLAGNIERESRPQLERILADVYDADIAEIEAEFIEYWEKR